MTGKYLFVLKPKVKDIMIVIYLPPTGVDPGFPAGGDTNLPGGAPTYDFAKIFTKLHVCNCEHFGP